MGFKQVALRYDGVSGFDFSVSPTNIELHPALNTHLSSLNLSQKPMIANEAETGVSISRMNSRKKSGKPPQTAVLQYAAFRPVNIC